jgi:hypothetical protein
VQWQLEKVVVRAAFHGCEARYYSGLNLQGFTLSLPVRGLSYVRHATNMYAYEGVNFWPSRHFGFHYGRVNRAALYGPRLASRYGQVSINYDPGAQLAVSTFEFRRQMRIIVRLIYLNYLKLRQADFLRSEVTVRW